MSYKDVKKKIKDVSEMKSEGKTFILYGKAGTGKTTILGTFPKVVHINVRDEGAVVLKKVKGLKTIDASCWQDLWDMYWFLKKEDHNFKTVGIDTAGNAQMMAIDEVVKKNPKSARMVKAGKSATDWGVMTQKMWGEVSAMCRELFLAYRDLKKDGINVVFIAHDKVFKVNEEDDDDDNVSKISPHVGPALSPSVASALNAAVDVIGETFIGEKITVKKDKKTGKKSEEKNVDYYLRIGPNSSYITKIRRPKGVKLPEVIKDPEYDDIMELMK